MNTYDRDLGARRALPGTARTPYRWRDGRNDHTALWAGSKQQLENERNQTRRIKALKQRKLSNCLMYATIGVVVMVFFMQIGLISTITTQQKRISAANLENQILAADLENLQTELSMQVRNDVIQQKAALQLKMVFPSESDIRLIQGVTRTASIGGASGANP